MEVDGDEFDMTSHDSEKRPDSWDTLARGLSELEREAYWKRANNKENVRVMVAADWHSFPRLKSIRKISEEKEQSNHQEQVGRWSDVCVTNLYTGNGLIGPYFAHEHKLNRTQAFGTKDPGELFKKTIESSLRKLREMNGEVRVHDELARLFLVRAAEISCGKRSVVVDYLNDPNNLRVFEPDKNDNSPFPLADWYLGKGAKDIGRPRYIVGTAAIRSVALQAGAYLYFSTAELTLTVRFLIDSGDNGLDSEDAEADKKKQEYISLIQQGIKHTTWQLSVAPTQWRHGRNRSLVLRLASVAYYTAEYYRTHADEFVRYIRDGLNERFSSDNEESSFKGVRMNLNSIRSSVRDCYSILRFDEIGTEFYDLDSTVAYLTNHAKYDSASVASEIYGELAMLRLQTLSQYENLSRMILWMRQRGGYRLTDPKTKRITELKKCAWNNYRIFNFYDSARLMTEAALILEREMEKIS